jgi:hypothetical protein
MWNAILMKLSLPPSGWLMLILGVVVLAMSTVVLVGRVVFASNDAPTERLVAILRAARTRAIEPGLDAQDRRLEQ